MTRGRPRSLSRLGVRGSAAIACARSPLWPLLVGDVFYQRVGALVVLAAISASAWNLIGGYAGRSRSGTPSLFGAGAYSSLVVFTAFRLAADRRRTGRHRGQPGAGVPDRPAHLPPARPLLFDGDDRRGRADPAAGANWPLVGAAVGLMGPAAPRSIRRPHVPPARSPTTTSSSRARGAAGAHLPHGAQPDRLLSAPPSPGGDRAASSLGVPVLRDKLYALMLSAAFTSIAGSLYAIMVGFADPDSVLGILISVKMVIVAALGGAGTLFGPLLGARDPGAARGMDQRRVRRLAAPASPTWFTAPSSC